MIKLIAKSNKGKDRIKRFGENWNLVAKDSFQGSPALLLNSVEHKAQFRWVLLENDKDFDIGDTL